MAESGVPRPEAVLATTTGASARKLAGGVIRQLGQVLARRVIVLPMLVVGAACASSNKGGSADAVSAAPLELAGQRVLILPVQWGAVSGEIGGERASAELVWALRERDSRVEWVEPRELSRALSRSPGFAADPERLPADALLHHGERYVADPLASELRRYAALIDARWVLLPHRADWIPADSAAPARFELQAAVLDARTGNVLWLGKGTAEAVDASDAQRTLAAAAASLARRLVAVPEPEIVP